MRRLIWLLFLAVGLILLAWWMTPATNAESYFDACKEKVGLDYYECVDVEMDKWCKKGVTSFCKEESVDDATSENDAITLEESAAPLDPADPCEEFVGDDEYLDCVISELEKKRYKQVEDESEPTPDTPESSQPTEWGAAAGAVWNDSKGDAWAGYFLLSAKTKEEAESAALERCKNKAPEKACKIVGTFSTGCGYGSIGTDDEGAGWFLASDKEEVLNDCKSEYSECSDPTGFCLD